MRPWGGGADAVGCGGGQACGDTAATLRDVAQRRNIPLITFEEALSSAHGWLMCGGVFRVLRVAFPSRATDTLQNIIRDEDDALLVYTR